MGICTRLLAHRDLMGGSPTELGTRVGQRVERSELVVELDW